jgi:glycerol-3-phosphate dehydrogenase
MKRNLDALVNKEYDVLVVGGGIFGICTVWDAALRGLSVALVEKGDFAHAASGSHFRMVHGGIRYLQHGDLVRVRESSHEQSAFLRIAPHMVYPLPIVVPTYGHGLQSKEFLKAGLFAYDLLTKDRNHGIRDRERHIKAGWTISREETLELFPDLKGEALTGAAVFQDGQMHNPNRLSLAFLKSAAELGADLANYVEAKELLREGKRVSGVRALDQFSGKEFEIRAKVVVNAAGGWAPHLLYSDHELRLQPSPVFSRDACFIVNRPLVGGEYALSLPARTKDPDAILSRGRRHLFLVPWQKNTLVGVWHVVWKDDPDEVTVQEAELEAYLDEINFAYPSLKLSLQDISRWMAGLVLFGEKQVDQTNLSYGKRSQIVDHFVSNQVEGLVTLMGVRFTTARGVAEKAVDLILRKLDRKLPKSKTAITPLHGGDIDSFTALLHTALERRPDSISAKALPDLLHNHGSAYEQVIDLAVSNPLLAELVPGTRVLKAEVLFAVRNEMAFNLGDIMFRRTDIATGGHPGEAAIRTCAEMMAAELGWDEGRMEKEIELVEAGLPRFDLPSRASQQLPNKDADSPSLTAIRENPI